MQQDPKDTLAKADESYKRLFLIVKIMSVINTALMTGLYFSI